jgi:dTDP-4-amino-4,6-dideoxygalactose transaminase
MCFENIEIRDKIYLELIKNGIKPRKYFYPLTSNFGYFTEKDINKTKKELKIANNISDRILCLPLYYGLEIEVVDRIIKIIKKVIKK